MRSTILTTGITADIRDRQDRNNGTGSGMLRSAYLQHPRVVYAKPSWRVVRHASLLARHALRAFLPEPLRAAGEALVVGRPIASASAC